jgi:uncharacterized protein YraI
MLNRWRYAAAALFVIAAPATALAARGYATASVNMRAGPSTQFPVVTTIPDNARVTIHGCLDNRSWCDVTWHRNRGWVSANYLNTFYNDRYVYLPDYWGVAGVPIVGFAFDDYWGRYYVGRPWYHRRGHWRHHWRGHHRGHGWHRGHRWRGHPSGDWRGGIHRGGWRSGGMRRGGDSFRGGSHHGGTHRGGTFHGGRYGGGRTMGSPGRMGGRSTGGGRPDRMGGGHRR